MIKYAKICMSYGFLTLAQKSNVFEERKIGKYINNESKDKYFKKKKNEIERGKRNGERSSDRKTANTQAMRVLSCSPQHVTVYLPHKASCIQFQLLHRISPSRA
jgi:hypothetical protein